MDFSTLKGLTIPEGVVTKITSGSVVLWQRPSIKTAFNLICDFTTDSTFGANYAQSIRIWEYTPDGEEVQQDMEWQGYTAGNTIEIACEEGIADISDYTVEWRMYNAAQTSYEVFKTNDFYASFVMPAHDVKIEVKVAYVEPKYTATKYKATVTEEYGIYVQIPLDEASNLGDYTDEVHSSQQVYALDNYSLDIYEGFVGKGYAWHNYNELDGYYNFAWNHASWDNEAEMQVYQYKLLSDDGEYAYYEQVLVDAAEKEYLGLYYSVGSQVGTAELTASEIRTLVSQSSHFESSGAFDTVYTLYVYESDGLYAYRFAFNPNAV